MRVDKLQDYFLPAIRKINAEIIIWILNYKITVYANRKMGRHSRL